jgi:Spy/CpxP family protein refolding chaperone
MKQRAYLYFVFTFFLGAIIGAVGLYLYAWYGGHWRRPNRGPGQFVQEITRQLKLTDQQSSQLTQIMNDSRKKYEDLRNQVRPQFEGLRDQTDDQIRQILTPDQVSKFNDFVRQLRARGLSPPSRQ